MSPSTRPAASLRAAAALLVALVLPGAAQLPSPAQKADLGRFKAGGPAALRGPAGAYALQSAKKGKGWTLRLNGRGAVKLMSGRSKPYGVSMERSARSFLSEARSFLGVDPDRLRLRFQRERSGLSHLWFDQSYGGLPVEFGRVAVHLTAAGEVLQVDSNFEAEPPASLTPEVDQARAAAIASADLGAAVRRPGALVLFPSDDGLRLAWKFAAPGGWTYYVDAKDGALLLRVSNRQYAAPCLPHLSSGTITGQVYQVDPLYAGQGLTVQPISGERVYVDNTALDRSAVTGADGTFCAPASGRIFTGLRGPYAAVSHHTSASAHYDNGGGTWQGDHTALASSPHPYSDSSSEVRTVTVPSTAVKVMPHFSRFEVGSLAGSSAEGFSSGDDDDELQLLDSAGNSAGLYNGDHGVVEGRFPFFGAAVEGSTVTLKLRANASGSHYGYDVDFSSYLVLSQTGTPDYSRSSFTWTSTMTFDGTVSQINLFYQLNRMHDFFEAGVNSTGAATAAGRGKLDLSAPVNAVADFGPGLANGFFNADTKGLYFGDFLDAFDLDATVIRHEYTHFLVDRIYPILNFGQGGAISEGNADYFSGTSFPGAGLPGIAAYYEAKLTGLGGTPQYTPLRTMDPASQANGNCSLADPSLFFRRYPEDWCGEIHLDGMVLSQSLWRLRFGRGALSFGGNVAPLGLDVDGVPKSDRLAFETLFFFPDSFEGYLQSMLTAAQNLGYPQSDLDKINAAFNAHGVSTGTQAGDAYEPNDGPATASGLPFEQAVSATVYPYGDQDFYEFSSEAGAFSAVLTLPPAPTAGTAFAYQLKLFDASLALVASARPPYDINGTSSGYCPPSTHCLTSASSVTLSAALPAKGQYYLFVGAGDGELGSLSQTSSTVHYALTASFTPEGAASASILAAAFNNDTLSFSVPVSSHSGGSAYAFAYARLRDQGGGALCNTRSDRGLDPGCSAPSTPGAFLTVVSTAAPPGAISGKLKLAPVGTQTFDQRFPAVGTVLLEVFGAHVGVSSAAVVPLGLSQPLNLTAAASEFDAWNNVFQPLAGQKATFRYDLTAGGAATLKLYTIDGAPVRTLLDAAVPAGKGSVDWDGRNAEGQYVASGVYLVRFECGDFSKVRKAVVVK